jgi:hypothetical protein
MKDLKTTIIVTLSVDGIHRWLDAKDIFPEVGFLSDYHRHTFKFKAALVVHHDDRDREFIMFKRDISDYLFEHYYNESARSHLFDYRSCEMLAREILNEFNCEWVEVWEDDECGARCELV